MKINSKFVLQEELEQLNALMRVFCSATRYAFNRLNEGANEKELIKYLQPKFKLNKRYAEDAVLQAKTILSSQHELLPTYLANALQKKKTSEWKLEEYVSGKRKPKKKPLEVIINGLKSRIEKYTEKACMYQRHIDNKTIPTIVFG